MGALLDAGVLLYLSGTVLYAFVFVRSGKLLHAATFFLAALYIGSLLDAAIAHASYASTKVDDVRRNLQTCRDPESSAREAKIAEMEQRKNKCVEAQQLAEKTKLDLFRMSIARHGWCAFILRYDPTSSIAWLANSHAGYYFAVTWFAAAALLCVVCGFWVNSRLSSWRGNALPVGQPLHSFVGLPDRQKLA